MKNIKENIEELLSIGIENNDIRQLLIGKGINYIGKFQDRKKGNLPSQKHKNRYRQKPKRYRYNMDERHPFENLSL